MKVTLNGTTLAESNDTVVIENNHYFPPASINKDLFSDSKTSTVCPWKGYDQTFHMNQHELCLAPSRAASYYNATVDDKTVTDVAW